MSKRTSELRPPAHRSRAGCRKHQPVAPPSAATELPTNNRSRGHQALVDFWHCSHRPRRVVTGTLISWRSGTGPVPRPSEYTDSTPVGAYAVATYGPGQVFHESPNVAHEREERQRDGAV